MTSKEQKSSRALSLLTSQTSPTSQRRSGLSIALSQKKWARVYAHGTRNRRS
eukprot:COSAG01_NODE_2300_length_7954_cov_7.117250_7_plen_52_part_00